MVHNIQRLQGEKKNGVEMVVHGRERDNFLDNFTFSNKAAFRNCTVIRRNVHIWGTKRPTAAAVWQCHRRPRKLQNVNARKRLREAA
jgi:hypothetical protein